MSKNKENDSIHSFANLIKEMQTNKKSMKSMKKLTEIKLIKTIFCLGSVSTDAFEKEFCLIMGTTLCNYLIIESKLHSGLSKKRDKKSSKKKSLIGGKNSRNNSGSRDNTDDVNIAAIALASAHTQFQLCGGSSGNALVQTKADQIREQIEELNLLTQLNQAETRNRQAVIERESIESNLESTRIAKQIVNDMLNSRVGTGTYLNVCAQSTTTCIACFALIQTTQQICTNIGNNVRTGITEVAESITPEVIGKIATGASTLAQNTGSWLSSTFDYMVGSAVPNITDTIDITPEDIAQSQTIRNQINHFILSNQTSVINFALRTDVQLSCAIGALTCCCLLRREYNQANVDRRTAALTYSGTFNHAAQLEALRSNGLARIVNAAASGITQGATIALAPATAFNVARNALEPPPAQEMFRLESESVPTPPLQIGNVLRRRTHRHGDRRSHRQGRRSHRSRSSSSDSLGGKYSRKK